MNPGKWNVNLNNHIFMLFKSSETCHPVSLPCRGTSILTFVTCGASFGLRVWSVEQPIQSLYPWVRCIYMQECSVHSLVCLLFPWAQEISTCKNVFFYTRWCHFYSLVCNVFTCKNVLFARSLVRLLFQWVQCQSLKPVLSQCSQTHFVTVNDFTALYTCSQSSIPMSAMYLYIQEHFLHSMADTITQFFTMLT